VSEIRKLISRWHRDELGAEREAARRECSKSLASRHYPQVRGARFAEGGGRFTGMHRKTLRLRYRTLKLRALCWVLQRLRGAGACSYQGQAIALPGLIRVVEFSRRPQKGAQIAMPRIKVRFKINHGRYGAPMAKLGKISEQTENFLRALAKDCGIPTRPGEWLAANFKDGSVEYDAIFQDDVSVGAIQVFGRCLEALADYDPEIEGLNAVIKPDTALEYARIGTLIDPGETVGLGIYPARGGRLKWRQISYNATSAIRRKMEVPIPSYGSAQGILFTWFKEAREPSFQLREFIWTIS
jgi:hypothetical protein